MGSLLQIGLDNAVQVTALAAVVFLLSRFIRNVNVIRTLWLLVLCKFLFPPLLAIPLVSLPDWAAGSDGRSQVFWQRGQVTTWVKSSADLQVSSTEPRSEHQPTSFVQLPRAERPSHNQFSRAEHPNRSSAVSGSRGELPAESSVWRSLPGVVTAHFVICLVWLSGSATWFMLMLARCRRFDRLLRFASRAPSGLQLQVRQLARQLKLRGRIEVLLVEATVPPFVWGNARCAVVVLPRQLLGQLSSVQQRMVLSHELAHLARHDLRTRWLESLVLGIYWWHPVAWIARHQFREAEELCCDSYAISSFSLAAREYAGTLLHTACFLADARLKLPQHVCGFGENRSLKRRIEMIVKARLPYPMARLTKVCLLTIACLLLPASPFLSEHAGSGFGPRQVLSDDGQQLDAAVTSTNVKATRKSATPTLLTNPSFDKQTSYRQGVPYRFGHWGGDLARLVTAEQGIKPYSGKQMLRFLGSGAHGAGKGYTACEVFQLIDLRLHGDFSGRDVVKLNVSLRFNRVHRNEQTDSSFTISAYACQGKPQRFHQHLLSDGVLAEASSYIRADSDPETWEPVSFSMRIPAGTTYLALRLTAGENVADDGEDEFHGHYADDVRLSLSRKRRARYYRLDDSAEIGLLPFFQARSLQADALGVEK